MDYDKSNTDVSENELRVLIQALTKSVEYIHKKHIILTFIAGFLIGFGVAVLVINLVSMSQKKYLEVGIFLEKTDETMQALQQVKSMLNNLTAAKMDNPGEKAVTDAKSFVTPQSKDTAVQKRQDEIALGRLKVYVHFAREKDKKIVEEFSVFLKNKGYAFINKEKIRHNSRDIRYFHDEDRQAAMLLQSHLNDFLASHPDIKNMDLNIKNWGKFYPNASKGSLEVWVFF
jgi:hypothetical protein